MADFATTGGYPKAACVASVDLPLAAQLRPGPGFALAAISLAKPSRSFASARRHHPAQGRLGFKLSRRDHALLSPRDRGG